MDVHGFLVTDASSKSLESLKSQSCSVAALYWPNCKVPLSAKAMLNFQENIPSMINIYFSGLAQVLCDPYRLYFCIIQIIHLHLNIFLTPS